MSNSQQLDPHFLTGSMDSIAAYRTAMNAAQAVLVHDFACQPTPYSGKSPLELSQALAALEPCPQAGAPLPDVLKTIGDLIIHHSVVVTHPTCIAHLHCPPLIPALAAEALISGTNQSMDSWDQSPAATLLEQQIVGWLCQEFGYNPMVADGIFTSGGTQSNFMGLLLARDRYCQQHLNWSVQKQGLPPAAARFRILCSTASHFTIRQAAALLGLGEQAVVTVPTDAEFRLCPTALKQTLDALAADNLIPIALVATVGTTDFGSIDPLPELAAIAEVHDLWLHVDAAYGGALILSDRHRCKLTGIAAADSITVDFHKLFYQPISCGAFLLNDRSHFDLIKQHADYLNPETNEAMGIPDLVTKSVQTTRRFDALKLWISLQTVGRQALAEMIDSTIDLAAATARLIAVDRRLELVNQPTINAVVFRYCPTPMLHTMSNPTGWANRINRSIRAALMQRGDAVLAQTQIDDRIYLKFTLLNPYTTAAQIADLLQQIKQLGCELESDTIQESMKCSTN